MTKRSLTSHESLTTQGSLATEESLLTEGKRCRELFCNLVDSLTPACDATHFAHFSNAASEEYYYEEKIITKTNI